MKKLNKIIYQKLLLQAEEAKEQGMTKLASGVLGVLGPVPEDEKIAYNFETLQIDVYEGLWKLAACVVKYHDLESADVEKINIVLENLAEQLIKEVETAVNVENEQIGPREDKIVGDF